MPIISSEILIQSKLNGKFYPVNTDSGEVELDKGEHLMKLTLEYNYELIDTQEKFKVYKKRLKRSFRNNQQIITQ